MICQNHGYSLSLSSLKNHLQRLNASKSQELQAAITDTEDLKSLYSTDKITQPLPALPPIRRLTLCPRFRYAFGTGNEEAEGIITFWQTVEKHLACDYSVGRLKLTKPMPALIK